MFIKRKIHLWGTGNSVVRVKNKIWYRIRQKLTKGQVIMDIKDKYATLRIYGFFGDEIRTIIKEATKECSETCESCGSKDGVKTTGKGWIYNLCRSCRNKGKSKNKNNG
jgi:hypothetical protein